MPLQKNFVKPKDFLPLTQAVYGILLALWDGEQSAHSLLYAVRDERTGQRLLRPATLPQTLQRLLEIRLVEAGAARPDPVDKDRQQPSFRLTALGNRVLHAEAERRWQQAESAIAQG